MKLPSWFETIESLIRRRSGPMTEELRLDADAAGNGKLPISLRADAQQTSVCGFCSTGCGLRVLQRDGSGVGVLPDPDYPVNTGTACPKGWEALRVTDSKSRATTPLMRSPSGKLEPASWDDALGAMTSRIRQIQEERGEDSVAFLSTGQIPMEEMALLGALTRFGMGIKHGDGNTRQCMATAVRAYKESFGFDAPPYTYADFEESDLIVLVGSNLVSSHPIMWRRIQQNRRGAKVVVIDPRHTETARAADLHIPLRPKSDLHLFYAVAHELIARGAVDQSFVDAHTDDFEAFDEFVSEYTLDEAAVVADVAIERLEELVTLIAGAERASFWWTMGVNQSHEGTRVAQSIINLALMTGNIGRPGTGANSITGQCNAMGSRLFSNTTNLLGGHSFSDAADREKVASILQIDEKHIPKETGKAYDQIIEGILSGQIRALWVIATNPLHSWVNRPLLRGALRHLDLLVVQDMYDNTETAELADIVLPAAGWGEKSGTFINSERRIGVLRPARRPPGVARTDFQIFRDVAHAWGCSEMFDAWKTPEDAFHILRRLTAGLPSDFTGVEGYDHLDECGGIQWPFSARAASASRIPVQERRMFEDGAFFRKTGRAKFAFEASRPVPEPVDKSYPMTLITGRGTSAQWHTMTRSAVSPMLQQLGPDQLYVEMNPQNARAHSVKSGDRVCVRTRRGSVEAIAFVTASMRTDEIFLPMHHRATNELTINAFDPYSRQPAYKASAARVERIGENGNI